MHYAIPKWRLITRFVIATAVLLPLGANAQVGFVADLALSQLCMMQNWDTKNMQRGLKTMPKQERMRLFGSLKFSSQAKRCLIEKKPAPVGLCDKVIAKFVDFRQHVPVGGAMPFQELSKKEEDKLWKGFSGSACKTGDMSDSADSWVPEDLRPDASTIKLLERAERGDVKAQMAAYEMHLKGIEVPVNEARADFWLGRAANSGYLEAQYLLGWKYSIGKISGGVDFSEAIHFLTKAASQGHREAMTLLGTIYHEPSEDGIGKAPKQYWNMKKALDLYTEAANLGEPNAAVALARIYEAEGPVPVDLEKALFWYEKSAQYNNARSMRELSERHQDGKGTLRNAKVAQQWRRRADALGLNGHGLYLIHYFPWGNPPEQDSAVSEIQLEHANAGDVDAQLAIASRYAQGEGVTKNEELAISWWKRAAETGDPIAQRMLGKYLIDDEQPRSRDPGSPGIGLLQKAAAQGDMEAQVTLAYWNVHGRGGKSDRKGQRGNLLEGIRLMQEAAERGYKPDDTMERVGKWKELLKDE